MSASRRPGAKPVAAATLLLVTLLGACATQPSPPPLDKGAQLLAAADSKLVAADYTGAIGSYNEFVTATPKHPQAARARATQKALEQLVAAQAAMSRTQQGSDASRRELAEKQAENERLSGEVKKLRTDLERLRSIDLQTPARTK